MRQTRSCGELWRHCRPLKNANTLRRLYLKQKKMQYSYLPGTDAGSCEAWTTLEEDEAATEAEWQKRKEQKRREKEAWNRIVNGEANMDYPSDEPAMDVRYTRTIRD